MSAFGREEDVEIVALEPVMKILLGGEPLGERVVWWNLVSSRKERIEQAKAAWKTASNFR